MIPRRWPLHPQPLPGEALSSWLERTASRYDLPLTTLLEHNLGTAGRQVGKVKLAQQHDQLDTDPPALLLEVLHERSGVPVGQLRHMTIAGWTPWLLDTLDLEQAGTFDCFVRQDSVLFDHTVITHGSDPVRWRPWLQGADGAERRQRACPLCAERPEHGLLLMAQLPIMLGCPEHGCLLQPAGLAVRRYPGAPDPEVTAVTEMVQAMDRRTHEGITTGRVTLPRRTVHVGVWFRLLRIVLDEVNTPTSFLRHKADKATLETIWARVERPVRAGQIRWAPYEALDWDRQVAMLEAAAMAMHLSSQGVIWARGTLGSLLSRELDRPVRSDPDPTVAWANAVRDFNAWLLTIVDDRDASRQLLIQLSAMNRTPEGYERTRQGLINSGLRAEHLPHWPGMNVMVPPDA